MLSEQPCSVRQVVLVSVMLEVFKKPSVEIVKHSDFYVARAMKHALPATRILENRLTLYTCFRTILTNVDMMIVVLSASVKCARAIQIL